MKHLSIKILSKFYYKNFIFKSLISLTIYNIKMSTIEKLAIRGIRSFDPNEEIKIEFFHPLTLIQGTNGSGKTVKYNLMHILSFY